MANLLSHPFRLLPNGQIATRDENTDEYLAERLALILSIAPGERQTVPLFGIDDVAFDRLVQSALQVQVELFGIPVTISGVRADVKSDGETVYYVDFERTSETNG